MARITIQLIPNAKENAIISYENGAWKIRIKAPPVEGRANEALIRFVADVLDIAPSTVSILKGHGSKHKTLEIQALADEIEKAFTESAH